MAYDLEDWRRTKQFTDNLPEMVGMSDQVVVPRGIIYFNKRGEVHGYIEEIGPGFYCAPIRNDIVYKHGDRGLAELEEMVFEQLLSLATSDVNG